MWTPRGKRMTCHDGAMSGAMERSRNESARWLSDSAERRAHSTFRREASTHSRPTWSPGPCRANDEPDPPPALGGTDHALSFAWLLVVAAAILALSVLAPGHRCRRHSRDRPSTSTRPAPGTSSEPLGYVCTDRRTPTSSGFPPGTKVHYTSQNEAGDVVQATITIQNGSTNGVCVWSSPVNAVCTLQVPEPAG